MITTPEPAKYLEAQIRALKDGRKPAVLLTKGEHVDTAGFDVYDLPEGRLIYSDKSALDFALSGKLGTALGYGIDHKPFSDVVLRVIDCYGDIVHEVITDGRESVIQAGLKVAGKGGSIEYVTLVQAYYDRHGVNTLDDVLSIILECNHG